MAKKHVIEYYKIVENQYFDMMHEVADFQKEFKDGFVPSAVITQAKTVLAKMKENYDRLSYIMLLLNRPAKNNKEARFNKLHETENIFLEQAAASKDAVIREDSEALSQFREYIKNYDSKEEE